MSFFQIETSIRWIFLLHAVCGALALGIFLIPLISKKGSKIHVRSGWLYTIAMVIVGFSAWVITPWRIFQDPGRNTSSQTFAAFLFFVATLTLASLWYGVIVLRSKKRSEPTKSITHIGPPIFLLASAVATEILGIRLGSSLLMLFPIIGIVLSLGQLRYWLRAPTHKMHWWFAHMDGMFAACIATITAFLVTAVPRLTDAVAFKSPIIWIAPGVILGAVLNRWTRYYEGKFNSPNKI